MRNSAISGEIDPERMPRIYATTGYLKESLSTSPAEEIEKASRLLLETQRPVVVAGNGVHCRLLLLPVTQERAPSH